MLRACSAFLLTVALTMGLVGQAEAYGPFGVADGTKPSKIPTCRQRYDDPELYDCRTLPEPSSLFNRYQLFAPEKTGVCAVIATSYPIWDGPYGDKTKARFNAYAESLKKTFGPWTRTYDWVSPTTAYSGPHQWLEALARGDRQYAYEWSPGKMPIKNAVKGVILLQEAESAQAGVIRVEYQLANIERCRAASRRVGPAD